MAEGSKIKPFTRKERILAKEIYAQLPAIIQTTKIRRGLQPFEMLQPDDEPKDQAA